MEPYNGKAPTNDWAAWVPPDESIRRVSERDHNGSRSETTSKTKSSYQAEPHGQGADAALVDVLRRARGHEGPDAASHGGRPGRASHCSSSTTGAPLDPPATGTAT